MSPSWIWRDKITNSRYALVGYNHFISNKGEWNNCFSKFSNRVLPPIFISTILQRKFLNLAHYFPYDVKLRLLAQSRRFLANQKARNAIVGAENLLMGNIQSREALHQSRDENIWWIVKLNLIIEAINRRVFALLTSAYCPSFSHLVKEKFNLSGSFFQQLIKRIFSQRKRRSDEPKIVLHRYLSFFLLAAFAVRLVALSIKHNKEKTNRKRRR